MSDSMNRDEIGKIAVFVTLFFIMAVLFMFSTLHRIRIESQLTAYQDSVNTLIAENKKLHAVQTMYSDTIVEAMKGEPIDFEKLKRRYAETSRKAAIATNGKFMTLREVNHGKDN